MSEILHDSTRSELESFLFQLSLLQQQGVKVGDMPDIVFEKLIDLIDDDVSAEKEVIKLCEEDEKRVEV